MKYRFSPSGVLLRRYITIGAHGETSFYWAAACESDLYRAWRIVLGLMR